MRTTCHRLSLMLACCEQLALRGRCRLSSSRQPDLHADRRAANSTQPLTFEIKDRAWAAPGVEEAIGEDRICCRQHCDFATCHDSSSRFPIRLVADTNSGHDTRERLDWRVTDDVPGHDLRSSPTWSAMTLRQPQLNKFGMVADCNNPIPAILACSVASFAARLSWPRSSRRTGVRAVRRAAHGAVARGAGTAPRDQTTNWIRPTSRSRSTSDCSRTTFPRIIGRRFGRRRCSPTAPRQVMLVIDDYTRHPVGSGDKDRFHAGRYQAICDADVSDAAARRRCGAARCDRARSAAGRSAGVRRLSPGIGPHRPDYAGRVSRARS